MNEEIQQHDTQCVVCHESVFFVRNFFGFLRNKQFLNAAPALEKWAVSTSVDFVYEAGSCKNLRLFVFNGCPTREPPLLRNGPEQGGGGFLVDIH